ncbi:hypothetical protein FOE78_14590 [Microlunatus elymi]|uniref:N-acetyltransferase domain-containing protein n=1 Tax=Microlunatus elymi TaxID=2596828 RepID=A0A516Q0M5_9ACTN|nr:hypothetical protein [Microlunatus elymi]QDP96985.1 hypothetical protein FOE78_14590 [Microlunatus elymi]
MSEWTADAVRRAAAAWVWLPDGCQHVDADYRLIDYPSWTSAGCQVSGVDSDRPAAEIIDETVEQALSWGRDRLGWWITEETRPATLDAELLARGAVHEDTVDVLAVRLTDELPDLGPMPGISVERVETRQQYLDADAVNVAVWNHQPISEERLQEQVYAETDGADIRVVAYLDGEPVASGGCTVVDGVGRLWGAATIESARGHGAYRAVLGLRMRLARRAGAGLALVKGRVDTSAPILQRVGFTDYGQERIFWLPISR